MERTLFVNGVIYTLDDNHPIVEAIVVENGYIKDVGFTKDMLLQWQQGETNVIDLEGKMVSPGLIDSHLHLSGVASTLLELDLTGVTSKEEMLQKIKVAAEQIAPGDWLVGKGWDENLFPDKQIPVIEELDRVAPQCPIYLKRICLHASLINTKALEKINYHAGIKVPSGGKIEVDSVTNRPTGLFYETASQLITEHIPEPSYDIFKNALETTMNQALKSGLTSVHTNDPAFIGSLERTYQMYDELINQENKGLRCNLLIDYIFLEELIEKGMYAGYGNDMLQIGAIKMFIDGAFGGRTALLSEAYTDDLDNYGNAMQEENELYEMVRDIRAHQMPVAAHTIGDQALGTILNVLKKFPDVAHRDRLIHTSLVNPNLIKELAHPQRIADIQPRFVISDYPWILDRLGKEREEGLYSWKAMLDNGVICAGGSDAPIEPFEPLLGMHAAVTRKAPGTQHNGFNMNEKLSMKEALSIFTLGGAYATSEENKKGTLTIGKLADMTVYSRNIMSIHHPDELLETEIDMTIIGGKIKYHS